MCSGCVFGAIDSVLATPNLDKASGLMGSITGKTTPKPKKSGLSSFLGGNSEPEPEPEPQGIMGSVSSFLGGQQEPEPVPEPPKKSGLFG